MEIQRHNGTLNVRDVQELSVTNARWFRNEICASLAPGLKRIDIDLSRTGLVDSCGLSALVSLLKAANHQDRNGMITVRLLNPQPPVQQMFELMRVHHLFEIVLPDGKPAKISSQAGAAAAPVVPSLGLG